jgi:outer membrane biogenesis lipoprotein LolB
LAAAAIIALAILFCCIKQRRAGKKEAQALLTQEHKEAAELSKYKLQMQAGKFGFGSNRV